MKSQALENYHIINSAQYIAEDKMAHGKIKPRIFHKPCQNLVASLQ